MNVKLSCPIIFALFFVNEFCVGLEIKSLGKESFNVIVNDAPESYAWLFKIIKTYHYKESPIKPINKKNFALGYNIIKKGRDRYLNSVRENEQWEYFRDNYLNKNFKDVTGEECIWEEDYLDELVESCLKNFNHGELDWKRISYRETEARSELLKSYYIFVLGKVKTTVNKLHKSKLITRNHKRVGILLMMEGIYKEVSVSFGGPVFIVSNLDIFSHAEMVNKYTRRDQQGIITIYCNLIQQKNMPYDDLCLKLRESHILTYISINRIYYKLEIAPDMWANAYLSLDVYNIDYLKVLKQYKDLLAPSEVHGPSWVKTSIGIIKLLETYSDARYNYENDLLYSENSRKIFNDNYLKHDKTVVFRKEEREGIKTSMREITKFLMKQFAIQKTFKVIILKNSVIDRTFLKIVKFLSESFKLMSNFVLKWREVQGTDLKDGFDSFSLENGRPHNLERWGYIKENFMKKSYIKNSQNYYNALESTVINEIAALYSHIENEDFAQFHQILDIYKNGFIEDVLFKLYLYTYELKINHTEDSTNLVKFSLISDYLKLELCVKDYSNYNIVINFINFGFDYKNLDDPTLWIRYIEAFHNDFPKFIQENYKKDGWIKENITFRFKIPELIIPEKLILENLKIPIDSRYQNNEIFLRHVLQFILNFVFGANISDSFSYGYLKIKDYLGEELHYFGQMLSARYEEIFGELPKAEWDKAILRSNLYEIKTKEPIWFKDIVAGEDIQLLSESLPSLFFREFHVCERNMKITK